MPVKSFPLKFSTLVNMLFSNAVTFMWLGLLAWVFLESPVLSLWQETGFILFSIALMLIYALDMVFLRKSGFWYKKVVYAFGSVLVGLCAISIVIIISSFTAQSPLVYYAIATVGAITSIAIVKYANDRERPTPEKFGVFVAHLHASIYKFLTFKQMYIVAAAAGMFLGVVDYGTPLFWLAVALLLVVLVPHVMICITVLTKKRGEQNGTWKQFEYNLTLPEVKKRLAETIMAGKFRVRFEGLDSTKTPKIPMLAFFRKENEGESYWLQLRYTASPSYTPLERIMCFWWDDVHIALRLEGEGNRTIMRIVGFQRKAPGRYGLGEASPINAIPKPFGQEEFTKKSIEMIDEMIRGSPNQF